MPIACTSTTVGSLRITVTTVHTVVSCVASRNRGTLGTPTEPDGQGAARDGGDSRDPMGRNSPTGQQKNYSAPRSLTARLGDSFYFAVSKIVESLLRRGARGRSALESRSWLGNKLRLPCAGGGPTKAKRTPAKHPTGAPGGRCLPAAVGAIRARKQSLTARWRKWIKQLTLFDPFPTPAVARGRAIPTSWNCPYAGRAVPPGTRYGPSGRKKRAETTPAKRPVGGAFRHSVLAIRARNPATATRPINPS